MKIVVTGGCGYIGSHIARAFKQNGDTIYIVDKVKRDHTLKDIDGWTIADFAADESLSMIRMCEPDVIVHCAGTSLVGPSMTNPSEYYHNNVVNTITMMNVIKDMPNRPKIMFSSSAGVYGIPNRWPIIEENKIQPISPYGSTKAACEMILHDYGKAYGIDTICFRYFNAAGSEPINFDLGQEPGATHIIARALEASLAKDVFTINGHDFDTDDGTCVRDYIHVWDIAIAHLRGVGYLNRLSKDQTVINEIFNLGTNTGISNLEIAEYVNKHYGLGAVHYGPRSLGDPDILIADASRAKKELGWTSQFSDLKTIIDSAHKWYTNELR